MVLSSSPTWLSLLAVVCHVTASSAINHQFPAQHPLQSSTLFNLTEIPLLGYGTWNLKGSNISEAVSAAIQTGYRHIDAAKIYGNQVQVGRGIRDGLGEAFIKRRDIWVTSKLWNTAHGNSSTVEQALQDTLDELGLDYLDLYLMHWPVSTSPSKQSEIEFIDTWVAMTKLLDGGRVRHVGVSNFDPQQLERLLHATPGVKPYAHQFETHPYLEQTEWISWHRVQGIHVTAYSPLGNTNPTYGGSGDEDRLVPPLLENKVVKKIAKERGCTPAQVALKWGLLRETSVIPKSQHVSRIQENFKAIECSLESDDIDVLKDELPTKRFNNPSKGWGVCLFEKLEDSGEC